MEIIKRVDVHCVGFSVSRKTQANNGVQMKKGTELEEESSGKRPRLLRMKKEIQ